MRSFSLLDGTLVHTGAIMTPKGRLQSWPHCFSIKGAAPPAQSFIAPTLKPMPYHNAGWDAPASGDCCAAAVAEIINIAKIMLGYTGGEIDDNSIIPWAKQVGTWNGGIIQDVLIAATSTPLTDASGQNNLLGGPPQTVNFEDMPSVYSALNDHYALNIGVDSSLYQACVTGPNQVAVAPILTSPIQRYDHSVPVIGRWGTAGYLADQYFKQKQVNVQLGNVPAETPSVVVVTWGCEVITPVASFQLSTNEAHAVPSFPAPTPGNGPVVPPVVPPPHRRPTIRGIELSQALARWHETNPLAVESLLDEFEGHATVQQALAAMHETFSEGRR